MSASPVLDRPTAMPSRSCPRAGRCAGLCADPGSAALYRRHGTILLARARRLLGDHGLAEDAVQETYLRAWRACGSFDPAGPPVRAWLNTILTNVVIDMARARARRPPVLGTAPVEPDGHGPDVPIDHLLGLRRQLAGALTMISPEHRHVVLHTIIRDRPYQEVALDLGVPAGTVKSRVYYALRHLRRLLDTQEQAAYCTPSSRPPDPASRSCAATSSRRGR